MKLRKHYTRDYDVILVGGGLANSIIAWHLHKLRPETSFLIIEQGAALGGNHTWSFYDSDLTLKQREIMQPFVKSRWDRYDVHFPNHSRTLNTAYNSVSSTLLNEIIYYEMPERILLGEQCEIISPTAVRAGAETYYAKLIIDGRGWIDLKDMSLAYQKFLGLEVKLKCPHGLTRPVIMDARVAQKDGFRFMYVLPLSIDELLIEDTRYSDNAELDIVELESEIRTYALANKWDVSEVLRKEVGTLPIVLAIDFPLFCKRFDAGNLVSGLKAGLFHPTTGYSLADAVKFAEAITTLPELNNKTAHKLLKNHIAKKWRSDGFYRMLNRMLFLAANAPSRYIVLQRFYRLPGRLIERFYAGRLTGLDKIRILIGKPPVAVWRALKSLPASAAWRKKG